MMDPSKTKCAILGEDPTMGSYLNDSLPIAYPPPI